MWVASKWHVHHLCVIETGGCYHWCVSHPDPPHRSLPFMWPVCVLVRAACGGVVWKSTFNVMKHAVCVCISWTDTYVVHGVNIYALCVCSWESDGESSTGQCCLLPWVTHSMYPTSPCNPLFFFTHLSSLSSSSSSSSSSSFSSLTHWWLLPHRQWHHHPLPNTLLWWITLYVQISSVNLKETCSLINSDLKAAVAFISDDCDEVNSWMTFLFTYIQWCNQRAQTLIGRCLGSIQRTIALRCECGMNGWCAL